MSKPPFAYEAVGHPVGHPKKSLRRTVKLTNTRLAPMFTESNELVMIEAHCLLDGFVVGAIRVTEKSGPLDVDAATAVSGKDEVTKTNAMTPRMAPFAVPFNVE